MPPKSSKGEYIETESGNRVSRKSHIVGTQNITLGGKTIIQADCTIRGDLYRTLPSSSTSSTTTSSTTTPTQPPSSTHRAPTPSIAIGRHCILSPTSVLHPPAKLTRGAHSHYPQKLGDHVFVGPGAVVRAASVGNHVHVGAGAVVGDFAILRDCVRVLEGCVVPAGMVVPSFSVVGGRPGRVVGEVPETGVEVLDLRGKKV
ncbi:MAG: Dynactin subunit 5 [Piccolia ochrophora]|nr:MAG: Dynactin subunit 5 [Piccolia ochrophora]